MIAFGDVHGDYEALHRLLSFAEVIDGDDRWIAGSKHLVSVGDLLDRGPDSRRVMDLLMGLETQAQAAGGPVHVLIGNHEQMNLTGDLRYVAKEEFAAFAGPRMTPYARPPPLPLGRKVSATRW
ncbi:MAG: metallophosphoesterase [Pseudomonadota bacterium]